VTEGVASILNPILLKGVEEAEEEEEEAAGGKERTRAVGILKALTIRSIIP
jgi:hypothetical protein